MPNHILRFWSALMFGLLIPIGSLDYFSINFDDNDCLTAYEGLAQSFHAFRHNVTESRGLLALQLMTATKVAYKSCIFYTVDLPSSIKKSMEGYSSLGDALGALAKFMGNNTGDASMAVQEILAGIKNKDVKRLQYVLRILIGLVIKDTKKGDVTEGTNKAGVDSAVVAQRKDSVMHFVKSSGILSVHTPQACLSRVGALVQQTLEAGSMIWTMSDIPRGIEKLLSLDEHIVGILNTCPEMSQHVIDLIIHNERFNFYAIFQNVMRRSGLIVADFYNAAVCVLSKNWAKAGAWCGLGVFNIFSPVPYDEDLMSSVYNE